MEKDCRNCSNEPALTRETIKTRYVEPLRVKPQRLVPDHIYEERLTICFGCDGLEFTTTCRYCGCLVQVRALMLQSECPFPYAPRWKRYNGRG